MVIFTKFEFLKKIKIQILNLIFKFLAQFEAFNKNKPLAKFHCPTFYTCFTG